MRILLDEHLSGRSIGQVLRDAGHDVLAIQEEKDLRAIEDRDVLRIATEQDRLVITKNLIDFVELARLWAGGSRDHAGCLGLAPSLTDVGSIARAIERALSERPQQEDWRNLTMIVGR